MINFIISGLWFYLIGGVMFGFYALVRYVLLRPGRSLSKMVEKAQNDFRNSDDPVDQWIVNLCSTPFGLMLLVGLLWPICLYMELFGDRK